MLSVVLQQRSRIMTVKIFRRGSARCIGLLSAFVTILLCLYYISMGQPSGTAGPSSTLHKDGLHQKRLGNLHESLHHGGGSHQNANQSWHSWLRNNLNSISKDRPDGGGVDDGGGSRQALAELDSGDGSSAEGDSGGGSGSAPRFSTKWDECAALEEAPTDITTGDEYGNFDFQPEWMKTKEYWDKDFENRYEKLQKDPSRPPLKIVVVPHSHNDPGWLKTFVNYFQSDSRQILNLAVTKMPEYSNMSFIWSEISFLQLWWDQAHPTKQRILKKLVKSGRLEITTGGWVMTDEANVHLFAMVDQLIEGHQWVKTNLNVTPKSGWSIDPFGHGSTVPYLLAASGFEGTIIQRIHYAWKQWFARHRYGDFMWTPYWKTSSTPRDPKHTMLTHNMPFDIYSIKHSCGPHPFICLNFDFRKIPGEYTEYSIKAQFITPENIESKADLLMEQYSRTASLFPHNVALIPVGDDFRYNKEKEMEQQYTNYKKLIDFINENRNKYKAEISFGTPKDYFNAIKERYDKFPTLKGDFFVYSDIFNEGRPAYWSGYFTTRPFFKILSRELEHNLRSLEILFTLAFNRARQTDNSNAFKIYEKNYEKIILARRNLGLFQHHDAITGTSKANVMRDYALRLFESIQDTVKLQEKTIELLVQKKSTEHNFLIGELERDNFSKLPRKTPLIVTEARSTDFVVYNALAQERLEVVLIRTMTPRVKILDPAGKLMDIQINPVWNITEPSYGTRKIIPSDKEYEIMFVAKLAPLSLTTFTAAYDDGYKPKMATLYCNECQDEKNEIFEIRNKQPGDIQLENYKMRLLFDEQSGFLKSVTKKNMGKQIQCAIKFAAYKSAQFHSGAYLFKADPEQRNSEKEILEQYNDMTMLITSGPLASDVTVIYGPFLAHSVRIYNSNSILDNGIYIENDIDFEMPPKNRESELFMRFITDIENGGSENPEFYSDLNGFQYQKRVKVPSIGIEGNYYPITSGAFIQDEKMRLTLLTTHAQGAASLEPGQLEVMLDRRTLYDDYRGMGEGVVDSRLTRHRFWVILETIDNGSSPKEANADVPPGQSDNSKPAEYQLPSIFANSLSNGLNYPANLFIVEKYDESNQIELNRAVQLLAAPFPCDLHILNLRTLTEPNLPLFPSNSALLVLHRQGYNCRIGGEEVVNYFCNTSNSASPRSSSISSSSFNYNVDKYTRPLQLFTGAQIEQIASTSLTGLHPGSPVRSVGDIFLEPMELRTYNVTFVK
ncbi:alpha-mannosidase 2 [Toxorhynchites rutilus septentrionalis]|uniref:alpha-mannosidase 2 n=1 Tax=Toxorhynchites rutilus septentrionalis TaxID=329112 RepID=UPI002479C31C|nr:alpha-mannosidase 2 [Toxorhynchites rutilus septentrionalis]XP_055623121.1 alpha-mannosidase 2 [Toxorhynchites rutilus septentrionalis]XP_055623124.1 alpha-mannosidase 2 [Toxorhynchites rutilus septentrionalis]XP_055623128.1 alpha-mannosidase 2 [Toxorhynchites rutilus septentrionalis]XP_055623130.1 alpha-mannosidase 2 [Toxorhynchites rutilus septentrionalis]